jgi:hypothetical protein
MSKTEGHPNTTLTPPSVMNTSLKTNLTQFITGCGVVGTGIALTACAAPFSPFVTGLATVGGLTGVYGVAQVAMSLKGFTAYFVEAIKQEGFVPQAASDAFLTSSQHGIGTSHLSRLAKTTIDSLTTHARQMGSNAFQRFIFGEHKASHDMSTAARTNTQPDNPTTHQKKGRFSALHIRPRRVSSKSFSR